MTEPTGEPRILHSGPHVKLSLRWCAGVHFHSSTPCDSSHMKRKCEVDVLQIHGVAETSSENDAQEKESRARPQA